MNFLKKKSVLIAIAAIFIVAIFIIAFVAANSNKKKKEDPPVKESTSKCVLLSSEDGNAFAVMEDGKVLDASAVKDIGFLSGSSAEVTLNTAAGSTSSVKTVRNLYSKSTGGIESSHDDAPEAFANFWLDNFLYNGTSAAISEYKVNNVSTISTAGEGRINIKVNFDVKPCEGVVVYGNADSDGYVKGIERSFSIYGTRGMWSTYEELYDIMAKNITKSANVISSVFVAKENQRTVYADSNYVYYVEKKYKTNDKAGDFSAVLSAFKVADKSSSVLATLPDNTTIIYGALSSGKLYLNSVDSNSEFKKMYCIDIATSKISIASESAMALTATNNTLYFVTGETVLNSLDIASGTVKKISTAPISLSMTKSDVKTYIKENELHICINASNVYNYKIDITTGKIETEKLFRK